MNAKSIELPFSQEIARTHGTIRSLVRWLESELQRQSRDGIEPDGPVIGPFRVLRRLLTDSGGYPDRTVSRTPATDSMAPRRSVE